jgi:hypothetical protein
MELRRGANDAVLVAVAARDEDRHLLRRARIRRQPAGVVGGLPALLVELAVADELRRAPRGRLRWRQRVINRRADQRGGAETLRLRECELQRAVATHRHAEQRAPLARHGERQARFDLRHHVFEKRRRRGIDSAADQPDVVADGGHYQHRRPQGAVVHRVDERPAQHGVFARPALLVAAGAMQQVQHQRRLAHRGRQVRQVERVGGVAPEALRTEDLAQHLGHRQTARWLAIICAYQRALALGVRCSVSKFTCTRPKRLEKPCAHSRLSSSDHAQ